MSAIILQLSTVMRTGLHNGSTEVLSLGGCFLDYWGGIRFFRISMGVVVDTARHW